MKAILIRYLLPVIMDAIFSALSTMVMKSSNPVDDKVLSILMESKVDLEDEIKRAL